MSEVALRAIDDSDLDALLDHMRDPESVRMAAFTPKNLDDRSAFDAHMARVRASPDVLQLAVTQDVHRRPLHARAASDNVGSLRVLQRCGFKVIGTEVSFAEGRSGKIEETILRLDATGARR